MTTKQEKTWPIATISVVAVLFVILTMAFSVVYLPQSHQYCLDNGYDSLHITNFKSLTCTRTVLGNQQTLQVNSSDVNWQDNRLLLEISKAME